MRYFVMLVTGLFLTACQQPQSPETKLALSTSAIAQSYYTSLDNELGLLMERIDFYCLSPSDTGIVPVREQWKTAMTRWQAASVINFGPVTVGSMFWKFQFWPDHRNLVKETVDKALAEDKNWNLAEIGNANVAARGFGALEYLLFSMDKQAFPAVKRCEYLQAVIADMKRNSHRLSRDWQAGEKRYPEELLAMASEQPDGYIDIKPVSLMLINSLYIELEQAYRKLTLPLGDSSTESNRYLAESWRSGTSLANLGTSLNAAKILFQGGKGYGPDDRLAGYGDTGAELSTAVVQLFEAIELALSRLEKPLFDSVVDPLERESMVSLAAQVKQLQDLFRSKIPKVLDIPIHS